MGEPSDEVATTPERLSRPNTVFAGGDLVAQRYVIVRFIAEGGMGEVYEARDTKLDERIALKTIRAEIAQKPAMLARFKREIHTARQVTHPNVCRVFDLGDHDGTPFLTMQLLEGESLSARIKREKRLAFAEARRIGTQIAAAIDAAHAANVIHRDLKPPNVILVPDVAGCRAVVTDFGLARTDDDSDPVVSRTGDIGGTPAYMAPEQVEGAEVDAAADVYAFGVMMFELVTGKRPFGGESMLSVAVKRLKEAPPSPRTIVPELDPRWEHAILRCMARDPAERFATAGEAIAAFDAPVPRRRRTAVIILAAAIVGVVAGAWIAYRAKTRARVPARDRVVVIAAVDRGDGAYAALAPTIRRLATHRLAERAVRFRVADDASAANVEVELGYRRVDDGIELDIAVGARGGSLARIGSARATSVTSALDQLLPALVDRVSAEQEPRAPTAAEKREMALLGTRSFDAYRAYSTIFDGTFASILVDDDDLARRAIEVVKLDPKWPHAVALLALEQGTTTDAAKATLERARTTLDRSGDPVGAALVDAMILEGKHDYAAANALLGPRAGAGDDLLVAWTLLTEDDFLAKTDDATAIARRMYALRPDLQFGSNLADELRRGGRADEIPALLREWLAIAPENQQAVLAAIAGERDIDTAIRRAGDLLLLYGRDPYRVVAICDLFIAAGRTREARAYADEAMRGSPRDAMRARIRLGHIAVLEGRFSAAEAAFDEALRSGVSDLGLASDHLTANLNLRDLYEGLGEVDRAKQVGTRIATLSANDLGALYAIVARVEADVACPDVAKATADLPEGAVRQALKRELVRIAADRGCVPCSEVVHEGLAPSEISLRSLYHFAVCAETTGNLELAKDAFERATHGIPSAILGGVYINSPFYQVRARYQYARLLERTNHHSDARRAYDDFLAHWGHADRPLSEIDEARTAVARLAK